MPDRFGENPDHEIANCPLCDDTGRRKGFDCDHIDHADAARRGMNMIRETMGWK